MISKREYIIQRIHNEYLKFDNGFNRILSCDIS